MSDIFYLSDRSIIKATGSDLKEFLQSIITNDINLLERDKVIFACLLTPQGKFLADFYIYELDNILFIDINKGFVDNFLRIINLYKLKSDVSFEHIEGKIYSVLNNNIEDKYNLYLDVRSQILGYRFFILDKGSIDTKKTCDDYHKIRIDNLIIDGFYDLSVGNSYIFDFGYEKFSAISFDKGCYIGQEVITRIYRRGVIRKKIDKFEFKDTVYNKGDEVIINNNSGVICSSYREKEYQRGLILIKNKR